MRGMRTLLTGFGPFGNTVNNPSARIVEHFARVGAPDHELTARVLPVSFARAEVVIRTLLGDAKYDAAVLLGVAGRETCFRLELFARLRPAGRADIDGTTPINFEKPGDAPGTYPATLSPELICEALIAAGFPARVSDDAGDYVCNHTYYAALDSLVGADRRTRCLFVHVPPDSETYDRPCDGPTMSLGRQIEGVTRILEWLAEHGPAFTEQPRIGAGPA